MPRYIDAEIMPHGPLWDELTDKEKANVLCYLLSRPGIDVTRVIFEEVAGVLVESQNQKGVLWTTREAMEMLLKKYNIEGGIEI
jgi:hypothetical protein